MTTEDQKPAPPHKEASPPLPPELDEFGRPRQTRVRPDMADADKVARTGSKDEPVRNTPPAGAWNDVSGD